MSSLVKIRNGVILMAVFTLLMGLEPLGAVHAQTLAKEQVLKLGINVSDITTLDPAFQHLSMTQVISSYIYSWLTDSPYGKLDFANLVGDVASSWRVTEGGKVWTFQLRKGIYFHDGNELFPAGKAPELTAEDVKYTFDRLRDPGTGSPHGAEHQIVDGIDVVDRYTVRFRLKQSSPFFAMIHTYKFRGGCISSKIVGEKIGKKGNWGLAYPIGTGPFKFAQYLPKEKVVLVANEKYFRGAPTLKRIEILFMPDVSSRTMAFVGGNADAIIGERDPAWIKNLKNMKPDAIVDAVPLGSGGVIHFNMTRKPLDNINVRRALAYAIDREAFKALYGHMWLECTSVVPAYYEGALSKKDTPRDLLYQFDLERAKKLLAEAGYANGFKLSAFTTPNTSYRYVYEIAQAAWEKIGVKLELKLVDHTTYTDNVQKDMNDVIVCSSDRTPVADSYLTEFWYSKSIVGTPTAMKNVSHYGAVDADGDGKIDNIDHLIEAARSELDNVKRNKLWTTAQMQVLQHAAAMPLHDLLKVLVRQSWVDLGVDFKGGMMNTYPLEKARILKH